MTDKKDGGPAFPLPSDGGRSIHPAVRGMSLRDWFAGMALQGLISVPENGAIHSPTDAKTAFELADAMIEEHNK